MKVTIAFLSAIFCIATSSLPCQAVPTLSDPLIPTEIAKLSANDGRSGDGFGFSVAIYGELAIVGAWEHQYPEAGEGQRAGAAYLFTESGNQLHKLVASDPSGDDNFGLSVAISDNFAVVGAPRNRAAGVQAGAAYVFDVNNGHELRKLEHEGLSPLDEFGFAVGLDGTTALIGAREENIDGFNSGAAYLFDVTTGALLHQLLPNDPANSLLFGNSVALSGSKTIVGAYGNRGDGTRTGAAYVFDTHTGERLFKLTASDGEAFDEFGYSVAIDGSMAIIGAPRHAQDGAAYLFDVETGQQLAKFVGSNDANNNFGWSVALSNGVAAIGASDASAVDLVASGSVILFDVITGERLARLTPSDATVGDEFGWSVAMRDRNTIIAGARNAGDVASQTLYGAAYIFVVPEPSTASLGACAVSLLLLFTSRFSNKAECNLKNWRAIGVTAPLMPTTQSNRYFSAR